MPSTEVITELLEGAGQAPTGLLMDEQQLAELLKIPAGTLRQWRYRGCGPKYVKVGSRVRYRPREVARWLDKRTRGGDRA